MRIAGTASVAASPARVYAALNDPAVLVRTIPGCERLEALGPDRFAMTITAGVASIKGSYVGSVELADPSPPSAFTLRASGAGAPGTVSATVRLTLMPEDGGTTVGYDADAVVGGAVGGVGQRVLSAVAKRTAAEFFRALETELTTSPPEPAASPAPTAFAPGASAATPISAVGARPPAGEPANEPANEPGATAGAGAVFTRPAPAPRAAPTPDQARSALVGAGIALTGVLVGWLIGSSTRPALRFGANFRSSSGPDTACTCPRH